MNKSELIAELKKSVDERISGLKNTLENLKESRNSESKSSMGDKYETGRSMIQMEIDQVQNQLQVQLSMQTTLEQINSDHKMNQAELGALVKTNKGDYLVAVALGVHKTQKQPIFCVSPTSPIAQAMLGLRIDDVFSFNDSSYQILDIS